SGSTADLDTTLITPNEAAKFPGGMDSLKNYLQKFNYPAFYRSGVKSEIIVKALVNEIGEIKNASILKSSGNTSLDAEALRLINEMPKWNPAKTNNLPVPSEIQITVPTNTK
ncbi:MAG: energy transducer TonB, partial [Bacteroidota bacterium]|nr:energy transducer TonB [Bacteroidota bacterium]